MGMCFVIIHCFLYIFLLYSILFEETTQLAFCSYYVILSNKYVYTNRSQQIMEYKVKTTYEFNYACFNRSKQVMILGIQI